MAKQGDGGVKGYIFRKELTGIVYLFQQNIYNIIVADSTFFLGLLQDDPNPAKSSQTKDDGRNTDRDGHRTSALQDRCEALLSERRAMQVR